MIKNFVEEISVLEDYSLKLARTDMDILRESEKYSEELNVMLNEITTSLAQKDYASEKFGFTDDEKKLFTELVNFMDALEENDSKDISKLQPYISSLLENKSMFMKIF